MEDYKKDIESTRYGCLGSSDAAMLARIAHIGEVPKGAMRRLAVTKGLIANKSIPRTDAIRMGDEVEMAIFSMLKSQDERYESNTRWTSVKYSRPNVTAIDHPDIILEDKEEKVLRVYEVKASRYTTEAVRAEYAAQLFYHRLFAEEIVARYGNRWRAKVYLVHYNTEGLDLSLPLDFDASRLTIRKVRMGKSLFDLSRAMNIVNSFLDTFDEYYEGDDIESEYLPKSVRDEFSLMTTMLGEIKEREKRIEDFKARLYDFMQKHDIKSVKSEAWSLVRVDASVARTFDGKRFLEDYTREHPVNGRRLAEKYAKTTTRKGSVQIRLRNKEK